MEILVSKYGENRVGNAVDMLLLADNLKELKEKKDKLEEETKAVNEQIEKTEYQLVQKMINEDTSKFTRHGRTFYLNVRTFASPNPGRKEELFNWLKGNGYGALVKETVNSQSLSSFTKELLEERDELPAGLDELINVYQKNMVAIRK